MNEILPGNLLEYVLHGREERYLEYKEILSLVDPPHKGKLVKAILGMSNTRDGGVIVIGVRKDGTPVGLQRPVAMQFSQDRIQALVNGYAAPSVAVAVTIGHLPDNDLLWFVLIQVKEFDDVPVICRRDGAELTEGAIYVRSRRIHETAEVRSEAEMREIIDTATTNGIRAFHRRVESAGLHVSGEEIDRQRFNAQLAGLEMAEQQLAAITNRPHWRVVICPTQFDESRIDSLGKCKSILEDSQVSLWSNSYPDMEVKDLRPGRDWLDYHQGSAGEYEQHWRFYQSGQFVHYFTLVEDFHRLPWTRYPDPTPEKYLVVTTTLYKLTEIVEFSARLAKLEVLRPGARFSVQLNGSQGRELAWWDGSHPGMRPPRVCQLSQIEMQRTLAQAELLAKPDSIAIDAAIAVFERFGWLDPQRELLVEEQRKLRERMLHD